MPIKTFITEIRAQISISGLCPLWPLSLIYHLDLFCFASDSILPNRSTLEVILTKKPSQIHSSWQFIMDKLPNEMLDRIFLESLPTVEIMRKNYWTSISAPLHVSHVCRRWRETALNLGELWSFLCIEFYGNVGFCPDKGIRMQVVLEIFDTWIRRSNVAPLNYQVVCDSSSSSQYSEMRYRQDVAEGHQIAESIVRTLIQHQHRWRDVVFLWLLKASPSLIKIDMLDMPLLVSLKLTFKIVKYDFGRGLHTCLVNLARSTRLQHLELSGRYAVEYGMNPFCDLTSASLTPTINVLKGLDSCLSLLRAAPGLSKMSAQLSSFTSSTYQPREWSPFVHHIRDFSIATTLAWIVLENLTLPSLKCLNLAVSASEIDQSRVLKFLERSMPGLEDLTIEVEQRTATDLFSILRLLPSLQKLTVLRLKYGETFFVELTHPNDERITCPALREFHIMSWLDNTELEDCLGALCDMLESRWTHKRTFAKVVCRQDDGTIAFEAPSLLVRDGLEDLARVFQTRHRRYSLSITSDAKLHIIANEAHE